VSSSALGRGSTALLSWASSKDFFQHDDSDDDDGLDDSGLVCSAAPITYESRKSARNLLGIGEGDDDGPLSAPGAMSRAPNDRQLSFEATPRMCSSHCPSSSWSSSSGAQLETIRGSVGDPIGIAEDSFVGSVAEEDSAQAQAQAFSPPPATNATPVAATTWPTPSTCPSTAPPTATPSQLNRLDSSRKEFLAMRMEDGGTKDTPERSSSVRKRSSLDASESPGGAGPSQEESRSAV